VKRIVLVEAVRGFAAAYVFAGHLIEVNFHHSGGWTLLFRFGQEAVIIFFVLSGFVIMHSTDAHADKSFRGYLSRRFLRIYPIFLLALALSYALSRRWTLDAGSLIGNVLMLQDVKFEKPGVMFGTFEGNLPLWSLSYEWWFYMMFFPLYRLVAERAQLLVVTAASIVAVVGYNATHFQPLLFVAYFPLWWAGVELARAEARKEPIPFARIAASLAFLALTFAAYVIAAMAAGHLINFGLHPALELRHALAGIAIVAATFVYRRFQIEAADRIVRPFAVIAPISYGIYALQWPVLKSIRTASLPSPVQLAFGVLAVIAVAYIAEMASRQLVMRLRRRIDRPVSTSAGAA
jgi:peptidoglycan/LPS O-acetylase OafA/YrhL